MARSQTTTGRPASWPALPPDALQSFTVSPATVFTLDCAAPFVWTTNNPGWSAQTTVTHDGVDAAESRPTADAQTSSFQTTVTGPGTLAFFWRVDSEETADFLSVEVPDTSERHEISGNTAWAGQSVTIPAGAHTAVWCYAKDGSDSQGEDRGWVDQVRFARPSAVQILFPGSCGFSPSRGWAFPGPCSSGG